MTKRSRNRRQAQAADAINMPTAKMLTWAKQHALWLYNKRQHLDQHAACSVLNQVYDQELGTLT